MIPVFQPLISGLSACPHPEKTKIKKGLLPLFHSIPLTELLNIYIYIFYEAHEDLFQIIEDSMKSNPHGPAVY